ncbi:hypothetical protein Ahy_A07g034425 isoform D [Arachis hypogaea]|uniref:Uncharacterized protein n=1 Tax=Arachis hypogaea TaxID=3818 RepID=A0A445CBS2_ARAHY|nr:hypothetical protein Ahy_A07g034425 isoform D [Arachis hypogaea]
MYYRFFSGTIGSFPEPYVLVLHGPLIFVPNQESRDGCVSSTYIGVLSQVTHILWLANGNWSSAHLLCRIVVVTSLSEFVPVLVCVSDS